MYIYPLFLILVLVCINFVICSNEKLVERIQSAHALFSTEGPTIAVLDQYNSMVKDIESQSEEEDSNLTEHLPQIYFKKALIEINLHKENIAIQDLKRCLKINSLFKPARGRLIDMLLEKGDFSLLAEYLTDGDKEIQQKIGSVKESLAKAESLFDKGDYVKCVQELEDKVIPITPSNPSVYMLHLKSTEKIYSQQKLIENHQPSKLIINDLNKLINLQPMQDLSWYESLANYLLFTEVHFEKSWMFVKNCLKIDNDFKGCSQISKFYVKFQQFLRIFELYSINNGHYYLVSDNNNQNVKEDLNRDIDFTAALQFLLQDEVKISKIEKRSLPSHVKSNYDYLLHKASAFSKNELGNEKIIKSLTFISDLNKIVCESLVQSKDIKKAAAFCSKVDDKESLFLPKHIPEVDKLLQKNKYAEAKTLLEKFNVNVRESKLFKDRYAIIERYISQQQQQQQQQQQRQWQQRQQQQRQQQQRAQPPKDPATDYYKILDISRDADEKTIKKAHRTQTLKYHPDKYKGNDLTPDQIENRMQDINKAYEVLADKELRERYDRGEDPNDPMGTQRQQQHPFGGGGGGGGGGQHFQFNFNQQDFVKQFMRQNGGSGGGGFGFGGFGGQGQRAHVKKNRRKNK